MFITIFAIVILLTAILMLCMPLAIMKAYGINGFYFVIGAILLFVAPAALVVILMIAVPLMILHHIDKKTGFSKRNKKGDDHD